MKFSVYQVSRKGGREKNEDRMGYCYTRDAGLFALADGMGGHPEGEVASQMALQTLAVLFQREARPTLADPTRFLHDAIMAGHHQLLRYATDRALLDTPRTTIIACVLQGNAAYWAHCGDSRLYLLRDDKLIARTRDHSYTELHETLSQVVPLEHRLNRSVLFTCLGSPGKPVVDAAGPLVLRQGDRVMPGRIASVAIGARAGGAGPAPGRRAQRQRHRARGGVGRPPCRRQRGRRVDDVAR
jgi:PPM family protein phosphatase